MFKKLSTVLTALAVVFMTGSFAVAQVTATQIGSGFPYFQLGCLIIGGLLIVSIKNEYEKLFTSEAIGAFALYVILISLFTNPVIDAIKALV